MIHLARDGTQLGQFTLEQVNGMLTAGQLKPTDLAWREGLSGWLALSELEGVSAFSTMAATATDSHPAAASVYAPPRSVVTDSFHGPGQVPPGSIQALRETRPWVLFLAILGIIGTGFMILAAGGMLLTGTFMAANSGMPAGMMAGMAVAYVVMALLYLYPIIKLFKYCGAIKQLSQTGSATDLDQALREQKSFWKFVGIVAIILMVVYFFVVVALVMGGAAGLSAMSGKSAPAIPAPTSSP